LIVLYYVIVRGYKFYIIACVGSFFLNKNITTYKTQTRADEKKEWLAARKRYHEKVLKVEEKMLTESKEAGASEGPDWLVEVFEEEPDLWNWMTALTSKERKERIKTKQVCQSLDDARDQWITDKK